MHEPIGAIHLLLYVWESGSEAE